MKSADIAVSLLVAACSFGGCSANFGNCPVSESGVSEVLIEIGPYVEIRDLLVLGDGCKVIAGAIQSNPGSGLEILRDAYLAKTDASGRIQWSKTWDWGPYDQWSSVQRSGDGGYYLAGITGGNAGFIVEDPEMAIARTDSFGGEVWSRIIRSDIGIAAASMCVNSDGTFVVAGSEGSSALLAKFDSGGDELWRQVYDRSSAYSVVATDDGGFAFSGLEGDYLAVVKTDPDGLMEWLYSGVGEAGFDFRYSRGVELVQTRDEGYAVVCDVIDEDFGYHLVVVKLDSSGSYLWGTVAPGVSGAPYSIGYALREISDGSLVAGGRSYTFHDVFSSLEVCYRFYGARFSADGQVLWSARLGDNGDIVDAIAMNPDGRVVFAGTGVDEDDDHLIYLLTSDAGG